MQGLQVSNHKILFYKKGKMQGCSAYVRQRRKGMICRFAESLLLYLKR